MISFADEDLARLLVALALLLIFAHGFGALFARFRQPPAVGEIVGGILLGPSCLLVISPSIQHWLFPSSGDSATALGAVYQLGLLLLMFAAGCEMRRVLQRDALKTVILVSGFGLMIPFAAGLGLVAALGSHHFLGTAHDSAALVLVFGMAVAVTSIPVISRIMHDLGLLPTRFARIVLSAAVVEDVVLYVVLAVAVGLVQTAKTESFGLAAALHLKGIPANGVYHTLIAVVFLTLALLFGGRIYGSLSSTKLNLLPRRSPLSFQFLWMLLLSAAALALGLVPLYGAFVAGVAVGVNDGTGSLGRDRNALAGFSFGFFVPVYFALIGIQLDLIHHFDPLFFIGFLAFACIVKAASVYTGARLSGEKPFVASSLAVAMNARGGPGIVLASTAYAAGIINESFFVSLVMLSVVTSLFAGGFLDRVAVRLGASPKQRRSAEERAEGELAPAP